jgi:hypothetical protein
MPSGRREKFTMGHKIGFDAKLVEAFTAESVEQMTLDYSLPIDTMMTYVGDETIEDGTKARSVATFRRLMTVNGRLDFEAAMERFNTMETELEELRANAPSTEIATLSNGEEDDPFEVVPSPYEKKVIAHARSNKLSVVCINGAQVDLLKAAEGKEFEILELVHAAKEVPHLAHMGLLYKINDPINLLKIDAAGDISGPLRDKADAWDMATAMLPSVISLAEGFNLPDLRVVGRRDVVEVANLIFGSRQQPLTSKEVMNFDQAVSALRADYEEPTPGAPTLDDLLKGVKKLQTALKLPATTVLLTGTTI